MNKIAIVAHRGGGALRTENSLQAFAHAIALGVDEVECDVHMLADGRIVVFHDFDLQQLTNQRGKIAELDDAQRQNLRLNGADAPPPLLEELAALLCPTSVRLHLEVKTAGNLEQFPKSVKRFSDRNCRKNKKLENLPELSEGKNSLVHEQKIAAKSLEILRHYNLLDRTSAISFEPLCLTPFIEAGVPSGPCIDAPDEIAAADWDQQIESWRAAGYRDLSLNGHHSPPEFVRALKQAGFIVGVWTINGPARLNYWLQQEVDYITTDQPDLALGLRDCRAALS